MGDQKQDLDFELIDDTNIDEIEVDTDEAAPASAKAEDGEGDDTTPAKGKRKKNSSNWKKVTKTNKALINENKRLRKLAGVDEADEDEDEDADEAYFSSTDLRLFVVENPESKEYKDDIAAIIEDSKGTLSFDRAFALAKAERPPESEDEDDFKTKGSNVKVKKRLEDLTEEEALKLPNNKYLEYQRKKGRIK